MTLSAYPCSIPCALLYKQISLVAAVANWFARHCVRARISLVCERLETYKLQVLLIEPMVNAVCLFMLAIVLCGAMFRNLSCCRRRRRCCCSVRNSHPEAGHDSGFMYYLQRHHWDPMNVIVQYIEDLSVVAAVKRTGAADGVPKTAGDEAQPRPLVEGFLDLLDGSQMWIQADEVRELKHIAESSS